MVQMEEEETAFDKIRTINNSLVMMLYIRIFRMIRRFLPMSTW